jgi:hypothetical protein
VSPPLRNHRAHLQDGGVLDLAPLTAAQLDTFGALVRRGGRYRFTVQPATGSEAPVSASAPAACAAQALLQRGGSADGGEALALHLDASRDRLVGVQLLRPAGGCGADAALAALAEAGRDGAAGDGLRRGVRVKAPVAAPVVPKFSATPEQPLPGERGAADLLGERCAPISCPHVVG